MGQQPVTLLPRDLSLQLSSRLRRLPMVQNLQDIQKERYQLAGILKAACQQGAEYPIEAVSLTASIVCHWVTTTPGKHLGQ